MKPNVTLPKRARGKRKPVKYWQAWWGTEVVEAGAYKNGKPRRTLVTMVMVAHTVTDARAIEKTHPHIKFVEKTR